MLFRRFCISIGCYLVGSCLGWGGDAVFEDDFSGPKLKEGWSWVREDPTEWRLTKGALELRSQNGRIWSGNDAKNVLLAPTPKTGDFTATVSVTQKPDQLWEQVGLLFYVNDDRFVKLISEFIRGKNYIVLARESRDIGMKNAVLAKLEIPSPTVELRLDVKGEVVTGFYRLPETKAWKKAASGALKGRAEARFGLFTQNGPKDKVHWAALRNFRVEKMGSGMDNPPDS